MNPRAPVTTITDGTLERTTAAVKLPYRRGFDALGALGAVAPDRFDAVVLGGGPAGSFGVAGPA